MTPSIDIDEQAKNPLLPFDVAQLDRFGLRLRPAEFARLLGCTRQSVSIWVRDGKITLGADGRLDPRQAVSQLLRNTDPAKLRAKVLQPLMRDIGIYQQKISHLEQELSNAATDAEFHEGASLELLNVIDRIRDRLLEEWEALREQPPESSMNAFCAWMENAIENAAHDNGSRIIDFLAADVSGALEQLEKGEGDSPIG